MLPEFETDLVDGDRTRVRFNFPIMPIKGQGMYRFIIEEATSSGEWRQLFEIPLMVSYQEQ